MKLALTPYEKARRLHASEKSAITFIEALNAHFDGGYVWNSPKAFGLARPVHAGATYQEICDPRIVHESANCWHIYLAAGDMREALTRLPFPLLRISFERKNTLRFYYLNDFFNRIHANERA